MSSRYPIAPSDPHPSLHTDGVLFVPENRWMDSLFDGIIRRFEFRRPYIIFGRRGGGFSSRLERFAGTSNSDQGGSRRRRNRLRSIDRAPPPSSNYYSRSRFITSRCRPNEETGHRSLINCDRVSAFTRKRFFLFALPWVLPGSSSSSFIEFQCVLCGFNGFDIAY